MHGNNAKLHVCAWLAEVLEAEGRTAQITAWSWDVTSLLYCMSADDDVGVGASCVGSLTRDCGSDTWCG